MEKSSSELADTKSLIEELQNVVAEKEKSVEETKEIHERKYKDAIESFNEEMSRLSQELQHKNHKLDELTSELANATSDRDEMKSQLGVEKERASELEGQLLEVEKQNAEEKRNLEASHQEELQELNLKFTSDLESLRGQLESQVNEEQVERLRGVYESEVSVLKDSLQEQKNLNGQLERHLEDNKKEYEEELTHYQEEVAGNKAKNEEWRGQIEALNAEVGRGKDALNSALGEKESHMKQITELQKELKNKERIISELDDNLSSYEEEHTSDVQIFERDLQKEQEKAADLEKQLVLELGNESARHSQEMKEVQAQHQVVVQELKHKLAETEKENVALQEEMEAFREKLAQYATTLEEHIRQLEAESESKHQAEMDELKEGHAKEVELLAKEVRDLQAKLEADMTPDQVGHVQSIKEDYEGQLQTLKEYIQDEREQHEKEMAKLNEVKEKQFIGAVEEVLDKHQRELSELKEYYEAELARKGARGGETGDEQGDLRKQMDQLQEEEKIELGELKEHLHSEAKAQIGEVQETLLRQITEAERTNLLLRQKLIKTEEGLSEVTQERDRLAHEVQVLRDTRELLQQQPAKAPHEPGLVAVTQEEAVLAQVNTDQLETLPPEGKTTMKKYTK